MARPRPSSRIAFLQSLLIHCVHGWPLPVGRGRPPPSGYGSTTSAERLGCGPAHVFSKCIICANPHAATTEPSINIWHGQIPVQRPGDLKETSVCMLGWYCSYARTPNAVVTTAVARCGATGVFLRTDAPWGKKLRVLNAVVGNALLSFSLYGIIPNTWDRNPMLLTSTHLDGSPSLGECWRAMA